AAHGHVLPVATESLLIADHSPSDIAHCVLGTATFEFVDGHGIGEVKHVDLFELGCGAEFGRHDVHGHIHERHDCRIALADPGGFDDHQVISGGFADVDDIGKVFGKFVMAAGGQRAEKHVIAVEAVHANAVAQQCSAALTPSGIDGDDGDT